jgi:hypothetical protein
MTESAAVRQAVDLFKMPSGVRRARLEPLPDGIPDLLRIAAGGADDDGAAVEATGPSAELLKHAATFYIEQILLAPGADSYRILGCVAGAPRADLRRNMALLLRWLHPDVAASHERAVFAARVTAAWDHVKTSERRLSYDSNHRLETDDRHDDAAHGRKRGRRRGMVSLMPLPRPVSSSTVWQRMLQRLIGRS